MNGFILSFWSAYVLRNLLRANLFSRVYMKHLSVETSHFKHQLTLIPQLLIELLKIFNIFANFSDM